jgi:hypothetical protein
MAEQQSLGRKVTASSRVTRVQEFSDAYIAMKGDSTTISDRNETRYHEIRKLFDEKWEITNRNVHNMDLPDSASFGQKPMQQ